MIALIGAYDRIRCLGAGLKELGAMAPHAGLSPRSGEARHTGNDAPWAARTLRPLPGCRWPPAQRCHAAADPAHSTDSTCSVTLSMDLAVSG